MKFHNVRNETCWVFGKQLHMVGIAFREGLSTSYGICLPVMQGMKATVGIVTEELRLIERLFQPLREYAEGA